MSSTVVVVAVFLRVCPCVCVCVLCREDVSRQGWTPCYRGETEKEGGSTVESNFQPSLM